MDRIIGIVEEAVDGIFKILEGSEYATLDLLLGELGKAPLDGVEPGGQVGLKRKTKRGCSPSQAMKLTCL